MLNEQILTTFPTWFDEASDDAASLLVGASDNTFYRNKQALAWRSLARDKQLPPSPDHPMPELRRDDWFVWLIRSGRGFGKTWIGSNWTNELAATHPGCTIALIGQTASDVRKTMIEINPSSILKQSPADFRPLYEPSKRQLTWPNGSIGLIYYGDEPDQLRGPQPHFVWIDELAKFKYPTEMWDQLEFIMRTGERPQVLVTTTPRPIPVIDMLLKDPATVDVVGSTFENEANLSQRFLERIRTKFEGTRLGRQELYGQVLDDAPGALWKRSELDKYRVTKTPDLSRVVVSIDPAATSAEDSNQTGLCVAALGSDKHGYTLDAKGMRVTPNEWAREAVSLYYKYKADLIIGEANNGGDMIEALIRAIDPRVNYKKVHASRGKVTRAEPVAALYEKGMVHHVGSLPDLEDQLCTWEQGMESPDLLDSTVWAITELMLNESRDAYIEDAPDWLIGRGF